MPPNMPDGAAFCFPSAFDFHLLLHCVLQTRCNANVILCCILNSNTLAPNQPALPKPNTHSPKECVRLGSHLTCSFTPTPMFQSPNSTRIAAVSCCNYAALFARVPVPSVHLQPELRPTTTLAHTPQVRTFRTPACDRNGRCSCVFARVISMSCCRCMPRLVGTAQSIMELHNCNHRARWHPSSILSFPTPTFDLSHCSDNVLPMHNLLVHLLNCPALPVHHPNTHCTLKSAYCHPPPRHPPITFPLVTLQPCELLQRQ